MSTRNTVVRNSVYAFVVVAVILSLLEAACQFIVPLESSRYEYQRQHFQILDGASPDAFIMEDPDLFWVFRPFVPQQTGDSGLFRSMFTNSRGLRDDEVAHPRLDGDYRILCIGDSCTFGVMLPYEQSFPEQIERLLPPPAGKGDVECINAGVPGYSSFQGLQYLTLRGWQYHPDLVIACFGLNDRSFWNNRTDAEHHELFQEKKLNTLLEYLAIYRGLRKIIHWISYDLLDRKSGNANAVESQGKHGAEPAGSSRKRAFQDEEEQTTFYRGAQRRVPIDDFRFNIKEIINFSRSIQADVLLINWPLKSQVTPPYNALNEYQRAINQIAVEEDVPVVDLTGLLKQQSGDIWLDRFHLDERGNLRVAEYVVERIKSEPWPALEQ